MKKFCTVLLLLTVFSFTASAENFTAWNLNDRINPQLKEYFTTAPEMTITPENLQELRKSFIPESLPKDDAVEVHDEIIGSNLRVRVYTPKTDAKELPALLWIHGGGHIFGIPEVDEGLCIRIAKEIGCIIANPDYRLAPEHPYPADVEDCYAALKWLAENPRVRKDRIAVAGGSAGGGLTVSVTLVARDKKYPVIHFQMPLYSQLDYRNITPSSNQITDHRCWCKDFNILAWKLYLANVSGDVPSYASPAMAEDLSGLPPAYIMVGTLDPFRDEDMTYAQRLMEAGVPVELHVIAGGTHAFEGVYPESPLSVKTVNEYVNALKDALK
ncbi:MAG: alpha/beta hydrolase [Synergistaceae bacterium]|nr:alpha/beta hydrolase [Synergistaceae bacterium]